MLYRPTHVVSVLTGTVLDQYGDVTDASTVAATGVPVSIVERPPKVDREDTATPRVVLAAAGRAPAGTPVSQGDRLEAADGTVWVVDAAHQPTSPVMQMDVRLNLRRLP
jgi:hypothetical protein